MQSCSSTPTVPNFHDHKAVPHVMARAVATPQHGRQGGGPPGNVRGNGWAASSTPALPGVQVVVAAPGSNHGSFPALPMHTPPVIVHAVSAQSLPGLSAGATSREMSRSRSFTGDAPGMMPTPRTMQQHGSRQATPRGGNNGNAMVAVNSWVPPPRYGSGAPPPCIAAVSWAPPPVSPTGTQSTPQFPTMVPPIFTAAAPGSSFMVAPQGSYVPFPQGGSFVHQAQGGSFVPPPMAPSGNGDGDPDVYTRGTEVVIGRHRFRCTGVLGRGSFSEVWSGEEMGTHEALEVALKDIGCAAQSDLQQALFEANMLSSFARGAECSYAQGAPPPQLRIPRYLSHRVDERKGGNLGHRMRMAMTRVPGEPLDTFLKRAPPTGQDVQAAVRRGCMLAMQMIRQLAPTLETISSRAVHRDVNAHNVLISDAIEGGTFRSVAEPEEAASRANFWLIDFGLAVDSTTWSTAWRDADIGGDCRYWPQSSWFVSFWGADEISAQKDLCAQYVNRLDIFGLGITALELLCTTALDGSNAAGCQTGNADGLRGSWRRLLNAWTKYWTDVTRWHTMIYRVFSLGGDVGPLYQELAKERVVDKILSRMANIRQCLRACVNRTEDPRIQSLLTVLAEMLDESSTFTFREAVNALGGECPRLPAGQQQMQGCPSMSYMPPKPMSMPCMVGGQPGCSPAQAAVQAMRADGAAAQAAAQGMVAQVAASARGRAEALQADARSGYAMAQGAAKDAQGLKLQWCAPSMNSNSFVPPPQMQPQSGSFVPPPQMAQNGSFVPPPQMPRSNSFVPPPHMPQSGSFVPPPHMPQSGSFVPPPHMPQSSSFAPPAQMPQSNSFVPPPHMPQSNSFVPPALHQSNSFVPPALHHSHSHSHCTPPAAVPATALAVAVATPVANSNSYVPMPAMSGGSYVPMPPMATPVMSHRPQAALARDGFSQALKHGPPRSARPQFAGA